MDPWDPDYVYPRNVGTIWTSFSCSETVHLEESMKISFKYGVSAIALLAAVSLAQAQTSERQGGGASGSEHSMGGRGGKSGNAGGSGASQTERSQGGMSSQHQGKSEGSASSQHQGKSGQEGGAAAQHEGKSAQERGGGTSASEREQQRGQSAERSTASRARTRRETGRIANTNGQVRPSAEEKTGVSGARKPSMRTVELRARKPEDVKRNSAERAGMKP